MFRLALLALLLGCGPALAQASCGTPAELRFAPGTSAGQVSGGVPRGAIACYAFTARAGQQLSARLTAPEDNAAFTILAPGWRDSAQDGPQGSALPGTEPGKDAMRFTGTLPANGRYLVVVGAKFGGSDFSLSVRIQ